MATPPPSEARITAQRYFALVAEGALEPEDRVELLEGVVVGMAPQGPRHGSCLHKVADALWAALPPGYAVRAQLPLVLGASSVPEPDVAVVAGEHDDYVDEHPRSALLVVEVGDASLPQDRITKQRIYAAAAIPAYWIVNLRDDCVEAFEGPEPEARRYALRRVVGRNERLVVAIPGARDVAVADLLPRPARGTTS